MVSPDVEIREEEISSAQYIDGKKHKAQWEKERNLIFQAICKFFEKRYTQDVYSKLDKTFKTSNSEEKLKELYRTLGSMIEVMAKKQKSKEVFLNFISLNIEISNLLSDKPDVNNPYLKGGIFNRKFLH